MHAPNLDRQSNLMSAHVMLPSSLGMVDEQVYPDISVLLCHLSVHCRLSTSHQGAPKGVPRQLALLRMRQCLAFDYWFGGRGSRQETLLQLYPYIKHAVCSPLMIRLQEY